LKHDIFGKHKIRREKTMKKMWIVMEIGCSEGSVPSNIVGVFDDKEKARSVAEQCFEKYTGFRGDNFFEVFEMPELNTINPEYSDIIL
jgi:hypothetical protein